MVHGLEPAVYIGKAGITENVIREMDDYLRVHELLKVKLQDGCIIDAKAAGNEAAAELNAEFVQAIGKKFSLYRRSDSEYHPAAEKVMRDEQRGSSRRKR